MNGCTSAKKLMYNVVVVEGGQSESFGKVDLENEDTGRREQQKSGRCKDTQVETDNMR